MLREREAGSGCKGAGWVCGVAAGTVDCVGEEKNKECESVRLPTSSSGSWEQVLKENSPYAALCVLLLGFLFAKMLPPKCVR